PTPLPLVGNLLTVARLPPGYEAYERWSKQYGCVFTYWVGEQPVVAITDWKTIQETFIKDADTFSGRYLWNETMELLR
ncbi:Protein CYP-33C1, partial [Aphelenchoides avenae]